MSSGRPRFATQASAAHRSSSHSSSRSRCRGQRWRWPTARQGSLAGAGGKWQRVFFVPWRRRPPDCSSISKGPAAAGNGPIVPSVVPNEGSNRGRRQEQWRGQRHGWRGRRWRVERSVGGPLVAMGNQLGESGGFCVRRCSSRHASFWLTLHRIIWRRVSKLISQRATACDRWICISQTALFLLNSTLNRPLQTERSDRFCARS